MVWVESGVVERLKERGLNVSSFSCVLRAGWHSPVVLGDHIPARAIVLLGDDFTRVINIVEEVGRASEGVPVYMVTTTSKISRLTRLARAGLKDCYDLAVEDEAYRLFETLRVLAEPNETLPVGVVADIGNGLERRVVEFCLQEGRRELTVDAVAAWFGMSRRALERRVGTRTGHTVAFWLNEGRIRYAYQRHAQGLSYMKIALEMGYASPSGVGMLLLRARRESAG